MEFQAEKHLGYSIGVQTMKISISRIAVSFLLVDTPETSSSAPGCRCMEKKKAIIAIG